ncbi:MAG: Rpn family recombination-promoting nuclease/putative transposase [Alphaproteobacteria bacterium]
MASRQVQRHDQFFQRLLDQPDTAGALLRERLPPDVVALLAPEPPELMPGSFVSRRLRGYRTDRLYKTRTITGRPALIYALVEAKSKPAPRIPLDLLGYQYQALSHWDRTEGRAPDGTLLPLPAIVTMVVYNGAAPWTIPLSLAEATDADAALRPYILDFHYSLVDLGRIPDSELSHERKLRVGLLILKHGSLNRATRSTLRKLMQEAMRLGHDDLVTLIYYLLGHLDDPKSRLVRHVLEEILPDPEKRKHVMSGAAEQWETEGFNKGIQQGIQQGRAEGESKGKAEMLLRQFRRRFGTLPAEIEVRVRAASSDQLDEWSERFVDARTLEDVFDEPTTH